MHILDYSTKNHDLSRTIVRKTTKLASVILLAMNKFKLVTAGGTFDRFHKGHRKLLQTAFKTSDKVVVGVTSNEFANSKILKAGTPLILRKQEIQDFLFKHKLTKRAEVVEISDMFGTLNKPTQIEAMIVTSETKPNALKVNNWRQANNLPILKIEEAELELAQDDQPISSTRIRMGEINREGVVWSRHKIWGKLPKSLRPTLRQPLGPIINLTKDLVLSENLVLSVGDVSTVALIEAGIQPNIAVVDLFVQRKRRYNSLAELNIESSFKTYEISNPRGELTKESVLTIAKTIQQLHTRSSNYVIHVVDGEEDLLTLPIILFAPLGSVVYYGQPPIDSNPSGMVVVKTTEDLKEKIFRLLHRFE